MSKNFSVALVGRTNVGKSSLFNKVLGFQRSIVGDIENLTRDFVFEDVDLPSGSRIQLFDTAGLESHQTSLCPQIQKVTLEFVKSVDLCLLVLDSSIGLIDEDITLFNRIAKINSNIKIVWNKEDLADDNTYYQAYRLSNNDFYTVKALCEESVQSFINKLDIDLSNLASSADDEDISETFGFFGRPNVGKSSLSNVFVKKRNRFIVSDQAGTTRDYLIETADLLGRKMKICDTAGLLNTRNSHPDIMERMTYFRTIMAMKKVQVAVLIIDASEGLTNLDKKILSLLHKYRRGLVIALNKWDLLTDKERKLLKEQVQYQLKGYSYAPMVEISAHQKTNLTLLKRAILAVSDAFCAQISTSQINKFIEQLVVRHEPPIRSGFRVKLRYMHVIDDKPLTLMGHGNSLNKLPDSYVRFLKNSICKEFNLVGIPLKIQFKNTVNPYAG